MGVTLEKGQRVNLSKQTSQLSYITVGLGWDPVKPKAPEKPSGLFGMLTSFFSSEEPQSVENIDLDGACVMFNGVNKIDEVYFGKKLSSYKSVRHGGDNLTGEGDGDDETIKINLLETTATTLFINVLSFRGQTFDKINNAYCRIIDASTGIEMVRFTISDMGPNIGLIAVKIFKGSDGWSIEAIGSVHQVNRTSELIGVLTGHAGAV